MTDEKTYKGVRMAGGAMVTVDGQMLEPQSDVRDFKAEGFEWGYEGSGPRQLAFALLADCFDDKTAFTHYRRFLAKVISKLQDDTWTMTAAEVTAMVEAQADNQADDKEQLGFVQEGDEEEGVVYVDMDLDTFLKKVRGEI